MVSSALLSSSRLPSCSGRQQSLYWRRTLRQSCCRSIYWSSSAFRVSRKKPFFCSALQDENRREQKPPPTSSTGAALQEKPIGTMNLENKNEDSTLYTFLYPNKDLLPDDKEMSIFDHLEELRERIFVSVLAVGAAMLGCFTFSKELIKLLEAPVTTQGVRFLQLSPGEFFFTTIKVSGYCGLLLGSPVIIYEIIAFVLPGLTRDERKFLGPIVLGSSVLFYAGIAFSYSVLTPAALNFFVSYAEGAVESIWSIDQYFEFVLVLMFSTGLSFQLSKWLGRLIGSRIWWEYYPSRECFSRHIKSSRLLMHERRGLNPLLIRFASSSLTNSTTFCKVKTFGGDLCGNPLGTIRTPEISSTNFVQGT